jgi:hypothetical protein
MRKFLGKNLRAFIIRLLFVCLIALMFGIWRSVGYEDAAAPRVAVETGTTQGAKTPKEHSEAAGPSEISSTRTSLDRASSSRALDVRLRATPVVESPAQKPAQVAALTVPTPVKTIPAAQVASPAPAEAKPAPQEQKLTEVAALAVPPQVKPMPEAQATSPAPADTKPLRSAQKPAEVVAHTLTPQVKPMPEAQAVQSTPAEEKPAFHEQKPTEVAAPAVPIPPKSTPAAKVSSAPPAEAKPAPLTEKPLKVAAHTLPPQVKTIPAAQVTSPKPAEARPAPPAQVAALAVPTLVKSTPAAQAVQSTPAEVKPSPQEQKPTQLAALVVLPQVTTMPAAQVTSPAPAEAKPAPPAHKPVQIAALTMRPPVRSMTTAQASSPAPAEVRPLPQTQKPVEAAAPAVPAPVKSVPAGRVSPSQEPMAAPAEVKPEAVGIKPPSLLSKKVSVELTADKTSPVPATVGSVIFTAHLRGESDKYEYKFWLKGPSTGNTWKVVQDFGALASYAWIPAMPGSYVIWVYSKDAMSPAGPEASAWMRFDVLDNPPVTSVEVTADKTSPALRTKMGTVTFTPRAAGGSGKYEYKFWLKGPSTGNAWRVAQDYGISDSFTWTPKQAGHYLIWLYARNTGSAAAREAAAWTSFDVVDNPPVGSVELSADKNSPLPPPADGITFTARAAGGSGKYQYEFWLKGPSTGNAWKMVQDYRVSNAFSWRPAQAGDYSIAVYARNEGSPAGHEAIAGMAFDITGK